MLRFLKVDHLAVVRSVALELDEGLTVLTGETGAGKSILVDALTLLLGARASGDNVQKVPFQMWRFVAAFSRGVPQVVFSCGVPSLVLFTACHAGMPGAPCVLGMPRGNA